MLVDPVLDNQVGLRPAYGRKGGGEGQPARLLISALHPQHVVTISWAAAHKFPRMGSWRGPGPPVHFTGCVLRQRPGACMPAHTWHISVGMCARCVQDSVRPGVQ